MLPFAFMGLMFAFVLVVVVVFVAPVAPLTCVLVVVVIVVLAFDAMFVFLVALVAVLLLAASPQAIPNAPSAKRVESAIIFLISKWTLLSFSKNITTIFTYYRLVSGIAPELSNFGTIDNIVIRHTLVNPSKA